MGVRPRASVFKITKSKFTPTSNKNKSSRKHLGSEGNTGNIEERSNSVCLTPKMEFISNLFLVSKKDGGQKPIIKLKSLSNFLSYNHSKMEGLHLVKDVVTERLHVQNRIQGCLLLPCTSQKLPQVYKFSMGRELIQNSYGFILGHPYIYKTNENPNSSLAQTGNSSYSLFGQYVFHGADEISIVRDILIFLLQHLQFVIDIGIYPSTRLGDRAPKSAVNFSGDDIQGLIKLSQEVPQIKSVTIWKLTSLKRSLCLIVQAVLPAFLQVRYL